MSLAQSVVWFGSAVPGFLNVFNVLKQHPTAICERFSAPLPPQWSEQVDETSSRVGWPNESAVFGGLLLMPLDVFPAGGSGMKAEDRTLWYSDAKLNEICTRQTATLAESCRQVYFFNRATGDSLWMHPQKSIFEDSCEFLHNNSAGRLVSTFGRPGSQNRERFVQIKYLKIVRSIST